jgi:soluble lytic murein transglycosylase
MTARRSITTSAIVLAGLLACRHETPAVSLAAEAATEPGGAEPAPPTVTTPARALWFADGPGRDAIVARERGDHAAARQGLLAVLEGDPSPADRAGAELLLGIDDARTGAHAAAAERFAAARTAPSLAAIELRVRILEAQARLDAGDPKAARALVERIEAPAGESAAVKGDLLVVQGDALLRTDDDALAIAAYRRYLADHDRGARRPEVTAKLAAALASSKTAGDAKTAASLFESLLVDVPLSDYAEQASKALPALRAMGVGTRGAALRELERRVEHARIEAMIDRSRYRQATRAADDLLAGRDVTPLDRCRAFFAKGTAVFKQRERAKSRTHFEQAVKHCKAAGPSGEDLLVKAGYQAARGRYAEGKYELAAAEFEALAKDHAAHTYADDAWVLAGESWESAGKLPAARKAWNKALSLAGDMAEEARRRLLVSAFAEGDDKAALALADAGLAAKWLSPAERAKLHYFRGRALARSGRNDEAKAAWLETLRTGPLEYPALQALSRLRELGDAALAEGVALVAAPGAAAPPPAPAPPSAAAVVLVRLGLGEWARQELEAADVGGWSAVAILNQAGLYGGAQRLLGSLGTKWRTVPPASDPQPWLAAHPQPFLEIVEPRENDASVPRWLTYAIMQTESRFEPNATSFAGARGLVQLMPSTARGVAKRSGIELGSDDALYDPTTNLGLGITHLGELVGRYGGGDGAVALAIPSYNAGAGAVEGWLRVRGSFDLDLFVEAIPYDETRKYTQSVLGRWLVYRVLYGSEPEIRDRLPYLALPIKRGA